MKNSILLSFSFLILISCSEVQTEQKTKASKDKMVNTDTIPDEIVSDSTEISQEVLVNNWTGFMGNFFAVKFPEEFNAHPLTPTSKLNDIESVDTDDAYFYAPDSSVIFYVFSPQWSGTPKNYLEKRSNEKEVDRNKKEMKDGDLITTIENASFVDLNNQYQRAFVSIREAYQGDVETIKVFGIQYKDQASYDKYRPAYKAFKKSLQQFAD